MTSLIKVIRVDGTETGYRNRIQDTEYRIQDTEYRIQDTEYRIQDTGYRIFFPARPGNLKNSYRKGF
ncbi:MAG: hypothetical protein ACXWCG_00430 [Flavitalea sp.]